MQQAHSTPSRHVNFRPVLWNLPTDVPLRDLQVYQVDPSVARGSFQNQYFDAARSAVVENRRQAKIKRSRRYSTPVSPLSRREVRQDTGPSFPPVAEPCVIPEPGSDSEHHDYYLNSFGRQEQAAMHSPPPACWHPFHVFSKLPTTPLLSNSGSVVSARGLTPEPILNYQQNLFKKIEHLCFSAARTYWRGQFSDTLCESLVSQSSGSVLSELWHLRYDNDNPGSNQIQIDRDEQDVTLMTYVQWINWTQLERAKMVDDDSDAAVSEAVERTQKLLTWAEQVRSLAERGGYGMSDDYIMEAVIGARDLMCWLLDDEGEVALKNLWCGRWIYGGLVMGEEDLDCCSD
ncbi:MAG: hypothetical protein Q9201_003535 [Fulgogasparrea decipioides]